MRIAEFLSLESVVYALNGQTKPEILNELAQALARASRHREPKDILRVLLEREQLGSTGIGDGVAIPHAKLPGLGQLTAVLGIQRVGVDFAALDGKPSHIFVALLAPENSAGLHLQALARISRLLCTAQLRQFILEAATPADIHARLLQDDARG